MTLFQVKNSNKIDGLFLPVWEENAGGLPPGKDNDDEWRKHSRQDFGVSNLKQYGAAWAFATAQESDFCR